MAAHGVPFEVVPGVTAAAGCGAYAGIPLTHRGLATGVRFVTGHCRNDGEPDHDWRGMADPDTTLVFYMALANLGMIRRELVAAGLDPATPRPPFPAEPPMPSEASSRPWAPCLRSWPGSRRPRPA